MHNSQATHDAKVCDILLWEQALCWARYVAEPEMAAVSKCYKETHARDRASCDAAIMALRAAVDRVRHGFTRDALMQRLSIAERRAVATCADLASGFTEDAVNASMTLRGFSRVSAHQRRHT